MTEKRPVAIVTGSAVGIGHAVASSLADAGYAVLVHGFDQSADGQALADSLPDAVYLDADLTDASTSELLVSTALDRWGRLDVLVNNAGVGIPIPHDDLDAVTAEVWDRLQGINLRAPYLMTRAARAALAESRGCVVNIASIAGFTTQGSSVPYSVAKAGVIQLTRLLAHALGPRIRVNAIAPGYIETERTRGWVDVRDRVVTASPLGRVGEPDDVARACLALIGLPYATGAILTLDGGLSLT